MSPETESAARLGRVLSVAGYLWALLYFAGRFFDVGGTPVGELLRFFSSSFFIPIALIFVGRAMTRRAARTGVEDDTTSRPRPAGRPPASRPAPAPPRPKPAPPPPEITLEPVDSEELARAIGFEDDVSMDDVTKAPGESAARPMTSEERIAEARRKYGR